MKVGETMIVAAMIQLSIVGSMALLLHSSILVLICARNFPMSLVHAPVNAAIAPRISNSQRATYLSVQGLAERVVFALFLVVLAGGLEKGQPVDEAALVERMETVHIVAGSEMNLKVTTEKDLKLAEYYLEQGA